MTYDIDCDEKLSYLREECETYSYSGSSQLAHASNICTKSVKANKKERMALEGIVPIYADYLEKQERLRGYSNKIVCQRVKLLNEYYAHYNELQLEKVFSSQGKFRSTILEEFMYILFRDYVRDLKEKYQDIGNLLRGGAAKAYTNLYFTSTGIDGFIKAPNVEINVKDQDFAIYRIVKISIDGKNKEIKVPIVAVENKTYLD